MSREDEIRARLVAATPGRWGIYHTSGPGPWEVHCGGTTIGVVDSEPDSHLIADAPADLAYLLDRVATLEAEKARVVTTLRESAEATRASDWAIASRVADAFLDAADLVERGAP